MADLLQEGYHEALPLDRLRPADDNPRKISKADLEGLKGSLSAAPEMLEARPLIAVPDGRLVGGEMRWRALQELGKESAPTFVKALDDATRREWMLRDNNGFGEWVPEEVGAMLAQLQSEGSDPVMLGFSGSDVDAFLASLGQAKEAPPKGPSLADRFLVPPFTTLDARQGYWRSREQQWLALGIRSEEGRGENLLKMSDTVRRGGKAEGELDAGTSIFSPTLCEIAYRWFSPPEGRVLDPFAGGSVRGITAALLRRRYLGIELSSRQVEANREQAAEMVAKGDPDYPEWLQGDSLAALNGIDVEAFDLVFTCPPYFDLERYSDDPRDLSAMDPDAFRGAYRAIIEASLLCLRPDRFAAVVVGDARRGHRQLSLVAETIHAFEKAGAIFYNEAIIIAPAGSASIRAARSFALRKLTRTHQHLLVFCKGDPKRASEACGPVEIDSEAFNE